VQDINLFTRADSLADMLNFINMVRRRGYFRDIEYSKKWKLTYTGLFRAEKIAVA
jgi:hypothetical protein